MAIKLGSTSVDALYLGESGYGLTNVVRVYLDSTIVWPVADLIVSGITDSAGTGLNGDYTLYSVGNIDGKKAYIGPTVASSGSITGRTIIRWVSTASTPQWRIGYESSSLDWWIDNAGYYFYSTATNGDYPPTTGWTPYAMTGSVTVVVNN